MKLKNIQFELIGWYGVLAIMFAYFLNSFGIIGSQTISYQLLNITGAIGCIIIAVKKQLYQSVFLNAVWTFIGLFALWSLLF